MYILNGGHSRGQRNEMTNGVGAPRLALVFKENLFQFWKHPNSWSGLIENLSGAGFSQRQSGHDPSDAAGGQQLTIGVVG